MAMSSTTNSSRYYIPALSGIYAAFEPYMLPLLRATLGLILLPHGCQKLFGWFGGMGFEKFAALFDKLGYKPGMFWVAVVGLTDFCMHSAGTGTDSTTDWSA